MLVVTIWRDHCKVPDELYFVRKASEPPAFGTPIRTDFLKGMAAVGKKFALILDIERVLSPKELLSTEAVEARPEASAAADGEDADWEIPTEAHKSSAQAAELTDPAS